ncbi:MAG: TIGR03621 family F420-dependent LLM class oxidoreductase [Actinobacteria bacterium]|nr:TIGR03621 family F420-dependent LLM class oxidoreductase [Actinomycetota bacterium]
MTASSGPTLRPFRFGVITSNAPDGETWRARARRAEALGYSTLFMPDHFQEQWAPIVGLTIAAEATERLNVGSLVFANDYRHPVVIAKEIATLDLATGGRVEFGIGAGWRRTDYEGAGLPYDTPGTRIDRMAEALTVMKALWSSEKPVHHEGPHYSIAGAVGTPRPHRRPHPRVCIGGGGRRVLSVAAREADIVGVNATLRSGELGRDAAASVVPSAFDEKVMWVRDAAGDRFGDIELQCHCAVVMIVSNRMEVAEGLGRAFGLDAVEALEVPITLIGTVDELCDALEERRHRYGISYWVVPDDAMEPFAPVVERLVGR